jgi:hypothetical protein
MQCKSVASNVIYPVLVFINNEIKAPGMLDFVRQTFTNALAMSQAAYDATVQTPLNQGVQAALASLVNPSTPVQSTPAQFAARKFHFKIAWIFCIRVADQILAQRYLARRV